MRARWVRLAIGRAVLMASAAALPCCTCAPPLSRDEPRSGEIVAGGSLAARTSLVVATWNLEWLNRTSGAGTLRRSDADYERLKSYADRLAADVIAVQEVDGEEALRRVFDDQRYDYHVASQAGVQRTGFAYRRGLQVIENADYAELDVGDVRVGTDLTVMIDGRALRLLGVHLKSGCFDAPLATKSNACTKLAAQLPALERWIDARAAAGEPFVVLGDFNRRMQTGEAFYAELDDGDPPGADLTLVTNGRTSRCWGGEYAQFIDHIVLSRDAAAWLLEGSFAQHDYDPSDAPFERTLSDHCPLSIVLRPAQRGAGQRAFGRRLEEPSSAAERDAEPPQPVKGNIGSGGRKLYHAPGCPSYEETRIDEAEGERYFASEDEALAAGWTKASNCP